MQDCDRVLRAYLLSTISFEEWERLQKQLIDELRDAPTHAALLCSEIRPAVSIGRAGSARHLKINDHEYKSLQITRHWQARGGGVWCHQQGQLMMSLITTLDHQTLPGDLVRHWQQILQNLAGELRIPVTWSGSKMLVRERPVAEIGLAISRGMSRYGVVLNVNPDLTLSRVLQTHESGKAWTSLERESPQTVRMAAVRMRILQLVEKEFSFDRISLFHTHPEIYRSLFDHVIVTTR